MLDDFGGGVWVTSEPVGILGMRLTATMTVLRLADGGLLLHSPVAMTAERRAAVDAIGPVRHVYAPNLYHHGWLGEWAAAYPGARVHGPAGLPSKRPELRVDRAHDVAGEPAFAGELDEVHVDGFRLEETVIVHRSSRTLVVADLVHNIGRPPQLWTRVYTGAMGFYGRVAISRAIRLGGFSDRAAARRSLDAILGLGFDRVVVGHGKPIAAGGREAIAAAYAWLPVV